MSLELIIQESINKNPTGVKDIIEDTLKTRVALALESKMKPEDDDEDDEHDDDEDEEDEDDE